MTTKDKALTLISENALLTEIVTVEPEVLGILLEAATVPPQPHWTRWDAYEDLKRRCSTYIGWYARSEQLATENHYEAFIRLIDTLLPKSEDYYRNLQIEEAS